MPRRSLCPRCSKRIPPEGDLCVGCGAPAAERGRRFTARSMGFAVLLALLTLLAVSYSDRYVPAVADWYTDAVLRFLPESAMNIVPATDERRAFYVCARRVVKRLESEASIATFASEVTTQHLGEGRFRVQSYVDEALEEGPRLRHLFRCTVRGGGGQWILEDLELELERRPERLVPETRLSAR
jgi:hypothetical protein